MFLPRWCVTSSPGGPGTGNPKTLAELFEVLQFDPFKDTRFVDAFLVKPFKNGIFLAAGKLLFLLKSCMIRRMLGQNLGGVAAPVPELPPKTEVDVEGAL